MKMKLSAEDIAPVAFTVGLFVIWEAACRLFRIDTFILPDRKSVV